MARQLPVVLAAALIFPQVVAAGAAPDEGVPCVGPMCMLTPFYKLRTMMPDMPESSEPAKAAPPPSTDFQAPSDPANSPPGEAKPTTTSASPQDRDIKNGAAVEDDARNDDDVRTTDDDIGKAGDLKAHRARRRVSRRSDPGRIPYPKTVVRRNNDIAAQRATVTVAADVTETDRLLRMASVVKSPRIQVVKSEEAQGCRQKPDFVVDTMSNPDRVGPAIPLFTEGLIILARKDVQDLGGLRGRQVSFGLAGSSSQRVAARVFRSLKIDVHEQPLDFDNALDGLTLGSVDAVAFLAPEGFTGLAHHDPQLHLLTVPDQIAPLTGLRVTNIDPTAYLKGLWSSKKVSIVTVDAVLSPSQVAHMQPNAQAVYAALDEQAPKLAANGFDLIGGSGALSTMRSSARDDIPGPAKVLADPGC